MKPAMFQPCYDVHPLHIVLEARQFLGLVVSVTHLCDENVEQDHNDHRHVAQDHHDRQPSETQGTHPT